MSFSLAALGFTISVQAIATMVATKDVCLRELGTFSFGIAPGKSAIKFQDPIEVKLNGKFYRWDGQAIMESEVRYNRDETTAAKKIWDVKNTKYGTDGRVSRSFPSETIDKLKESFIALSFAAMAKEVLKPAIAPSVFQAALACRDLKDMKIGFSGPEFEKTVGEESERLINTLKAKFPDQLKGIPEAER